MEIQNSTENTIYQIENILNVINNINDIVSRIAGVLAHQSNIAKEIYDDVSPAVNVADEVAHDIVKMTQRHPKVDECAMELNFLADKLKVMVDGFTIQP